MSSVNAMIDIEYVNRPPQQFECEHEQTQIVRRKQSNGILIYVRQCLHCGRNRGAVAKGSPEVLRLADIPEWDQALYDAWQQDRTNYYEERRQERAAITPGSTEWWKQYDEYLSSPQWQEKRAMVLKRDDYICQGCFQARAYDVHHLSYRHMGNELLFELVSVCRKCHRRIHPEME